MDFAVSNRFSATFHDRNKLDQVALGIRELNQSTDYAFSDNSFFKDGVLVGFLNTALTEPLFFYTFNLQRKARSGFMVDEVNVHTLGNEGYTYRIMKSREVNEPKPFLNLGKHAFVLTGSNGQGFLVEDKRWILIYDQHTMLARRDSGLGTFLMSLDIFWSTVVEFLVDTWKTERFTFNTITHAIDVAARDMKFV